MSHLLQASADGRDHARGLSSSVAAWSDNPRGVLTNLYRQWSQYREGRLDLPTSIAFLAVFALAMVAYSIGWREAAAPRPSASKGLSGRLPPRAPQTIGESAAQNTEFNTLQFLSTQDASPINDDLSTHP